jgi:hypothetical protein
MENDRLQLASTGYNLVDGLDLSKTIKNYRLATLK